MQDMLLNEVLSSLLIYWHVLVVSTKIKQEMHLTSQDGWCENVAMRVGRVVSSDGGVLSSDGEWSQVVGEWSQVMGSGLKWWGSGLKWWVCSGPGCLYASLWLSNARLWSIAHSFCHCVGKVWLLWSRDCWLGWRGLGYEGAGQLAWSTASGNSNVPTKYYTHTSSAEMVVCKSKNRRLYIMVWFI